MVIRSLAVTLVSLLILALAPVANAAPSTFFVSTTGSNSAAGTEAAPWRTIDHSLRQLRPGDTLVVRGGTYVERVRNPSILAGTASAPITVRAATGERPVVRGLFWVRGTSHWTFDGINVTWDDATGQSNEHMVKLTDGVGWTFKNGEIWGAKSFAGMLIASSSSSTTEPAQWRVADNCIHSTHATNGPNQDQLIYANPDLGGTGGVIERNILHTASNGHGIKLGGPAIDRGGARGVVVRHNTVVNTAHNILVAWRSHANVLEGNLLSGTAGGHVNMRGHQLTGVGNRALNNAGTGSRELFRNDAGFLTIEDAGGNRFGGDPRFEAVSCTGLRPGNPDFAAYGHLAGGSSTPVPPPPAAEPVPAPDQGPAPAPGGGLLPGGGSLSGGVLAPAPDADDPPQSGGSEEPPAASPPETSNPGKPKATRVRGKDRVATSAASAAYGWTEAETVVLARADDPADALAGSALAGHLGAPLLVTPRTGLTPELAQLLRQLSVSRAVLLGGAAALSDQVDADARTLGLVTERIAGRTRVETAALIADRLGGSPSGTALVVRGSFPANPDRSWADALAVSGLAARQSASGDQWPILVTDATVPAATSEALRRHGMRSVLLVGGTATIPAVTDQLLDGAGLRVQRLSGASRYATSRVSADLRPAPAGAPLVVATGDGFADGLSAGALVARLGATLLLVPRHGVGAEELAWLSADPQRFGPVVVVGGPAAVSERAVEQIEAALGR